MICELSTKHAFGNCNRNKTVYIEVLLSNKDFSFVFKSLQNRLTNSFYPFEKSQNYVLIK